MSNLLGFVGAFRNTSISYSSTSPWNSTGFYYSPRYPEAYRGEPFFNSVWDFAAIKM